jgi:8-oxo-dGTP pyrophosphatase MutT (NUDIX family)
MPAPRVLTEALVRDGLRATLRDRTPARAPEPGTASAVLVPLFGKDGDCHVWLARRSAALRRHAGQVSFPGGKRDPADASGLATALREAEEEIGLGSAAVDVLGQLDDLVTGTGFTISPFVGWVAAPFTPRLNPAEVERVFAAPLRVFFDKPRGVPPFHGHTIDGELVWGATGKILRDLVSLVDASALLE